MHIAKCSYKNEAGATLVCSGHDAEFEAAIHLYIFVIKMKSKKLNWNATCKDLFIVAQLKQIYFC